MTSKVFKVTAAVVVGILSLSSTVAAGYKVYKNNPVKANILGINTQAIPTPEIKEVVENSTEVINITSEPTTIPNGTIIPVSSPLPTPIVTGKPTLRFSGTINPTLTPSGSLRGTKFEDSDDDDVKFEKQTETIERDIDD